MRISDIHFLLSSTSLAAIFATTHHLPSNAVVIVGDISDIAKIDPEELKQKLIDAFAPDVEEVKRVFIIDDVPQELIRFAEAQRLMIKAVPAEAESVDFYPLLQRRPDQKHHCRERKMFRKEPTRQPRWTPFERPP
jgi:UDP-2,3-diacylglucosamine pyrophosphatase LpxH